MSQSEHRDTALTTAAKATIAARAQVPWTDAVEDVPHLRSGRSEDAAGSATDHAVAVRDELSETGNREHSGPVSTEQVRATADLLRVAEGGDHLLRALVNHLGVLRALDMLHSASHSELIGAIMHGAQIYGITAPAAAAGQALNRWQLRMAELHADRDLRIMARLGARLVIPGSSEWPTQLSDLGLDEPLGLWVRGERSLRMALEGSVAIVGARAADSYGQYLARSFAFDCVQTGHTVVSGGAYGIDAAAHHGALAAIQDTESATTVAFMAGGVDRFYPRGNDDMLRTIAARGLVVSEAPPGATAMRHRFLLRNRLIAAGSLATVVVQAGWRSGAINTANRAAELTRVVTAVPGPVTSAESAGCHRLIREGAAQLVTTFAEVAELAGPLDATRESTAEQAAIRATDDLDDNEKRVHSALPQRRGKDVAAIAVSAGLDTRTVMTALAGLELAGLTARRDHGWVKATP